MHSASLLQFSTNLHSFGYGLLAELPTILDSFFTNTTSDYIEVVGWGVGEPCNGKGKHVK